MWPGQLRLWCFPDDIHRTAPDVGLIRIGPMALRKAVHGVLTAQCARACQRADNPLADDIPVEGKFGH